MSDLPSIQTPDIITFSEIPPYEVRDYDVFDEKDFRRYITDVKKTVRGSIEYRQLIQYLRNYFNMNTDSFFENISNADSTKIKIELHHTPYTLEDICTTVFNKRMFYGEDIDVEDIAKEVMYIHYFLMVGLIPLSETDHELVHNNFLFVPTDKVAGNYHEFENMYGAWIPEETKEKVKAIEDRSKVYNAQVDLQLLEQKHIPIEFKGDAALPQLPTVNEIESMMNNKLQEIKYQNEHAIEDHHYDNNIIDIPNNGVSLIRGVIYEIPEHDTNLVRGVTYED